MKPVICIGGRPVEFIIGEVDQWGKVPLTLAYQGLEDVTMPDIGTLERLTNEQLRGGYEELRRLEGFVSFRVDAGMSNEQFAAFYGAACAHVRVR